MSEPEAQALPSDPVDRVRAVIERVLDEMDVEADVDVTDEGEEIYATVEGGDELGMLIGRRGQTLDALQLLCYRAAFQGRNDRRRVTIDAAGYRERRREALEDDAESAAHRALRDGTPTRLEPMSASERRMVHEFLKERADVETYSEGDDPERRVVVAPLLSD